IWSKLRGRYLRARTTVLIAAFYEARFGEGCGAPAGAAAPAARPAVRKAARQAGACRRLGADGRRRVGHR
ncbi:MAG TPA: hypothetical protein PKJ45_05845, partial [Rubrivivax sp.]|nr:hypothetical protein [Rubrivivax sp.]